MSEDRLYSVGELAKKCGVSVRTLQFYDKCGLISPGTRSDGGRRLYGRQEILKLHQVLFLKSFGFSLDEIRIKLMPIQTTGELKGIMKRQQDTLAGQISLLQDAYTLISKTMEELERSGDIPMTSLMAIMSAVQRGHSYAFVLKYFGMDELDRMVGALAEQPNPFEIADEWQKMIDWMLDLYKNGIDPEGEEGQKFADQWWKMISRISNDNPQFLRSALSAGADVDNWPENAGEFKSAIKEFVGKAIGKYVEDNGIALPL